MKRLLATLMASLMLVAGTCLAQVETAGAPLQQGETFRVGEQLGAPTPDPIIFDSFTGAATLTATSGSPRTFIGGAATLANVVGPEVDVTGLTVYLLSTATQSFSNGLRIRVQLWDTYAHTTGAPLVYSSAAGGLIEVNIPGPVSLNANNFYPVDIGLPTPVRLNGLANKGFAINIQGDNGGGMASTDALTVLLAAQPTPGNYPTLAVGTNPIGTAPAGGFYRNVANQTTFNFSGSDLRTFTGQENIRPAFILRGVAGGPSESDLSITKTDNATTATPGGTTTYVITVTNTGTEEVSDAEIQDTFPSACTSVNYTATQSGGATGFTTPGSGNIDDSAVVLPGGASVTYTAECAIDPAATGTLSNTATVSSADANDPDTDNNTATDTTTLVAVSDLAITKTDGVTTATPGGTTTYTIVATNNGPSNASAVAIVDTFPSACTSVSYTGTQSGGATGFTTSGSGNINDPNVVLPSGASVTYTAECAIDPAATGTLSNTATVASAGANDPNTDNNSATDVDTLVAATGLSISKTDNATTVVAGGSTTYTIVASNAGPSAANPVAVVDTFPAACASVSYTAVQSGGATGFTASGAGNINDAAVNLPAGSSVTYTAVCTLASDASGTLVNTATISGGSSGTSQAADSTTIQPRAVAPAVTMVPTLGAYALGLLGLMLGLLGFMAFRRHA